MTCHARGGKRGGDAVGNAIDELGPVVGAGLAPETSGGIPGGEGGFLHPAPVGLPGEKQPEGFAQGAGEVGDGSVGGEDEVELGDGRGGVGEVVVAGAGIDGAQVGRLLLKLNGGGAFLERDPADAGEFEEGKKRLEGGGALAVGTVAGIAGPVEADGEVVRRG
jgi:hypothetical protein